MNLFAVATIFNMNVSEESKASKISLKSIEIMAQAEAGYPCCPYGCLAQQGDGCYSRFYFPDKKPDPRS